MQTRRWKTRVSPLPIRILILSPKCLDDVQQMMVTLLAQVLCPNVGNVVSSIHVVKSNPPLLDEFANEEVAQRHMPGPAAVGTVSGNVKC